MSENTSFTACFLYLTQDCNMRCKYCFENENRGTSYMSIDVAKKSIDFLIRNALEHNIKLLNITFFGGEPLLNLDTMIKVFWYALDKGNENGIELRFPIITNGTIYNEKYGQLLLDIYKNTKFLDIQISIDGIPEVQDKNRIFINGKPTSELVVKNIIILKTLFENNQIDTSFIRVHSVLTKNNISQLFSNYKYFKEIGISKTEFVLLNEEDWDEKDISIYNQQLLFISDYIYKNCIKTCSLEPHYEVGGFTCKRKDSISEYSCAAGRTFCSIAPNGDIYPCHRFYSNGSDLKLGNVFNGIIDNSIRNKFIDACRSNLLVDKKSCGECENTECVICMAYNYEKYGDMLKCNPGVCSMYRTKYNFIIKAEDRFKNLQDKLNYNKCSQTSFLKSIN